MKKRGKVLNFGRKMVPIYIANDHHGRALKKEIIQNLAPEKKYEFHDLGCEDDACDHPIYAKKVAEKVVENPESFGILICGSGVGMSLAANKVPGAFCALANSVELARGAREHNGANILALGAKFFHHDDFLAIVQTFLTTPVLNDEKYVRRRKMIW